MADSLGQSFKASDFGMKKGKKNKQEGLDTPEAREARILLYMERKGQQGKNGRPVDIFTGKEYTQEEVEGVDDGAEDE